MASLGRRGSSLYLSFHSHLSRTICRQSQRGFASKKGDAQKPHFTHDRDPPYRKPPPPPPAQEAPPIGGPISTVIPRKRVDIKTLPPSINDPKRTPPTFPRTSIAYMGGIVNPNAEYNHTAFKVEKPVPLSKLKEEGVKINLPIREYYENPGHWKFGKSHLLMALEMDVFHLWVRPPEGQSFPACDHARLSEVEFLQKYPYYIPPLQRMVPYADDWIVTDLHTFYTKTQAWTIPLFEKALGCKIFKAGTPQYSELAAKDELDGKQLVESDDSWVGPKYLQKLIAADKATAHYQRVDL